MAVSISAVVLLAALVVLLIKKAGMKIAHAVVCVLFGFFLAGSSAAPGITSGVQSAFQLISKLDF